MKAALMKPASLCRGLPRRRGIVLPSAAICLVIALAFLALSIDLGYICMTRHEAQNAADAAALAGAQELYPDPHPQTALKLPISLPIYKPVFQTQDVTPALNAARDSGSRNRIATTSSPDVLQQDVAFSIDDAGVIVGPPATIDLVDGLLDLLDLRTSDHTFVNSIEVKTRRDQQANGNLKLFFGAGFGSSSTTVSASARASVFRGYGAGVGDKVLPFAMDITVWNALRFTNSELNAVTLQPLGINLNAITLAGLLGDNPLLSSLDNLLPVNLSGSPINVLDAWTWKRGMTSVSSGADGLLEVVLPADQFRTVQGPGLLGILLTRVEHVPCLVPALSFSTTTSSTPNASQLTRIIRDGLSASDIATVSTSNDNRCWLPFSAKAHFEIPDACETELINAIGKPRILPLYATLPGTISKVGDLLGAAHTLQIVGWAGVVVTEVNLHGPVRYINVQPAIYTRSSILAASGPNAWRSDQNMSDGVYTCPRLVK
jgi:hypothetical protein